MNQNATGEEYEVFAFRYASRPSRKASEYYGFASYGDDAQPYPVSYYFWLARNDDRIVLIDSGYAIERSKREGRFQHNDPSYDPVRLLAQLDISPGEIEHIIVTHMHRDHAGNLDQFPNASVTMARQEYEFCTGPIARKSLLTGSYASEETSYVEQLLRVGRLSLIDDGTTLLPGIEAIKIGGHAPGQLIVDIASSNGNVLVASDALHFYDQLDNDRPHWFFYNLEDTYRGFETVRKLAARPGTSVAPGHDPAVVSRFRTVVDDLIVDLAAPVQSA